MTVRILMVEDSEADAELIRLHLERTGRKPHVRRVETREQMSAALEDGPWDVVLADYSLPRFGAVQALEALHERKLDLPFIVVSGTVGEDRAIALMRKGAHDFVPKHELARLEPVIVREMREAENRRLRQTAEADRERTVRELERANRSKDEFLALLGHELRNPLAPIVTALQVMKLRGDEPTREQQIIERQVAHLSRLVDDLLDVAKIARGKVAIHKVAVSLAEVIASAVEMASPILEQRRQHLKVDIEPPAIPLRADPARLAQVFSNLVNNAARYTPPGGNISVTARLEGGEVVVRVKDDGMGIEPELLPGVFDLFTQGRRAGERDGLGLGLTVVRSLVALHGGTVAAHSEGVNRGTEIEVRLPAAAGSATPVAVSRVRAEADRRRLSVLVVDDNEDAAILLAEAVELFDHAVAVALDPVRALELADQTHFDAIVLDIGLPGMDGYELARRLRQKPRLEGVRLIAVTGYGQVTDREKARDAGIDVHFTKPVDIDHLISALSPGESR